MIQRVLNTIFAIAIVLMALQLWWVPFEISRVNDSVNQVRKDIIKVLPEFNVDY